MNVQEIEDLYSLSPLQHGMLFHTVRDPNSGVYTDQLLFRIRGDIDRVLLERAWNEIVSRHSALRTAFVYEGLREPVQVVLRSVEISLRFYDWSEYSAACLEDKISEYMAKESEKGFSLAHAPLMRLALFQLGTDRHYFLWTYHHILLDAWSAANVIKEVVAYYARRPERHEQLFAPPACYKDYIAWLAQQDATAAEVFWRQFLAGLEGPTNPLKWEKDLSQQPYITEQASLSYELSSRIVNMARSRHVTLNTILQSAWAVLLSRYSGENDIVFGTTVSGRPPAIPGIEAMVGLLINTLPVRVQLSSDLSVANLLVQMGEIQQELRNYEYSPLVEIKKWSRLPSGKPLFESIFVLENIPEEPVRNPHPNGHRQFEIEESLYFNRNGYPLTMTALPGPELRLRLTSCQSPQPVLRRMLGHIQLLLQQIVGGTDLTVGDLELTTAVERALILKGWNPGGTLVVGDEESIATVFEKQVQEHPEKAAVSCGASTISYRQLDGLANEVATRLAREGVTTESRVGICIGRSLNLVVAVMGVVTAAGVYVPLDPSHPPERLKWLVKDAGLKTIVGEGKRPDNVVFESVSWVDIEQLEADAKSGIHEPRRRSSLQAANAAYVIYTSGSTGLPKGVQVTHYNVLRLLRATAQNFTISSEDCWTLFHSSTFDFSVWEMWGALLYGGRLVVVSFEESRSPESFARLVRRENVTVVNMTPSAFQGWRDVEEAGTGLPPTLRLVIFGGEALQPAKVDRWFTRHGDVRPKLVNMYGITETTVHVTEAEVKARAWRGIGRPLQDMRVYILDGAQRLLPPGVVGELFIGGGGLARGYLDRPDKTAEVYVPDSISKQGGERLYRSGDMGCWDEEGNVEYRGRKDGQIKIRGYR